MVLQPIPVLLFRSDANSSMGTGHLMRCTALAEYLAENFICKLITRCNIEALLDVSRSVFSEVYILSEETNETELLEEKTDQWKLILLDGYGFDNDYQKQLKLRGFSIAAIDDIIANQAQSDLVLNHCGALMPSQYKAKPWTVFALGPSYALLRKNFLVPKEERRTVINDRNCFICFGGADPLNDTLSAVKELTEKKIFTHLYVIVGAAYKYRDQLQQYISSQKNISCYQAVDAERMIDIMRQCSYAILSASSVVFEYLALGGIVWVKMIADNQKYMHRFLINEGLGVAYESAKISIEEDFSKMLCNQQQFFDGKYDQRLKKLFASWLFSKRLKIRNAEQRDAHLIWQWANDPVVREQSYSSNMIPWNNHITWFSKKLNDTSCYYYILENEDNSVGQIRFDIDGENKATLSYLIAPSFRSKGMGAWILSKGIKKLLCDASQVRKVIGHVKKINIVSQKSFEKLNFVKGASTAYPDSYTYLMQINEHSN